MLNLAYIETVLQTAVKERNQIKADTFRALKTRIQNEQISKGAELSEDDILNLVNSEAKKRKEAVQAFADAGRSEQAEKESAELAVLTELLPAQLSEDEISQFIDEELQKNAWTQKDFGTAMATLKSKFGNSADGAVIAKILKQKLN